MNNFNEAIEIALRTWYPIGHELHLNPHHPLGQLISEWGELMGDQIKITYKPDYKLETEKELGDIWYYIRILYYQQSQRLNREINPNAITMTSNDADYLIACAIEVTAESFQSLKRHGPDNLYIPLNTNYSILLKICQLNNVTIDELTTSNWDKLKPGSERGDQWMKARLSTEYVGGKVAGNDG